LDVLDPGPGLSFRTLADHSSCRVLGERGSHLVPVLPHGTETRVGNCLTRESLRHFGMTLRNLSHLLLAGVSFSCLLSAATPIPDPIPEPATYLLMGGGLAALALVRRFKNRK
jgi:hypothetical protein